MHASTLVPFELPPCTHNERGELRKVGFEIEFAGPELDEVARRVQQRFGGQLRTENKFIHRVAGTPWGDFSIELDSSFFKKRKHQQPMRALGLDPEHSAVGRVIENVLVTATGPVFPKELVTPPIPLSDLAVVEELRLDLLQLKASGTKGALVSAFGLHINPEVPNLRAPTLLSYLRAFLLLYDWMFETSDVDYTRRVAPYIRPFPEPFVSYVLDPRYNPSIGGFIWDYLARVPSRNHPLDLLPLLAYMDQDLVEAKAKERHLVKARPTFHYRLPNSLVDDPNWRIAGEWNRWVEVERLAADPEKIAAMTRAYSESPPALWVENCRNWLVRETAA